MAYGYQKSRAKNNVKSLPKISGNKQRQIITKNFGEETR